MKTFRFYIELIVALLCLHSCVSEEKDIFDESAANRMNRALAEYNQILESAPAGWLMEYYAGGQNTPLGGYNYLCSFKDGKVALAADYLVWTDIYGVVSDPYHQSESLYRLIGDQGPVLTFDTYNELLHAFSEPLGAPVTLEGDYEFIFMSVTEDRIELKGKKNKNRIVLTRLESGTNWETLLAGINDIIYSTMVYSKFNLIQSGSLLGTVSLNSYHSYTFTIGDATVSENAVYTTEGIRFSEPVELPGGIVIESMKWNATEGKYVSTGGSDLSLVPEIDPSYLSYQEIIGVYTMYYINDYIASGQWKSRTVRIDPLVEGVSFTMTGQFNWPVVLGYDRYNGQFTIDYQQVSSYSDGTPIVLWSFNGVSSLPIVTLYGTYSGDPEDPYIEVHDPTNRATGFAWINVSDNNYLMRDGWGDFGFNYIILEKQ